MVAKFDLKSNGLVPSRFESGCPHQMKMENGEMTCLQMGIMLAAYTGNSGFNGCSNDTQVWRQQCQHLMDNGMIEPNSSNLPRHIKITEKGKFWLDFVLNTKYPTQISKYQIGD